MDNYARYMRKIDVEDCGFIKHLQLFSISLPAKLRFLEFMGRLSHTLPSPKHLTSLLLLSLPIKTGADWLNVDEFSNFPTIKKS